MRGELQIVPPISGLAALGDSHLVPALIIHEGEPAGWRYVEFFTANIRNPHTRRAYARACSRFFGWCEARGLTLAGIRPFDRRRRLGRGAPAGSQPARSEAAARGRAHAV